MFPTLNQNTVITGLRNMIISQQIFSDNLKGGAKLADRFRTDGTLYGDTKAFYAVDTLRTYLFNLRNNKGQGGMAYNVLNEFLAADPAVQLITIDTFRQVPITIDDKLSKQAFFTEGAFSDFVGVTLQQLRETKKLHENGIVNAYVGRTISEAEINTIEVELLSGATNVLEKEAENRLNGLQISEALANLRVELEDFLPSYNDYGFIRSYEWSDFMIIWNAKYINAIRHVDLPTIFHKEGVTPQQGPELSQRWFSTTIDTVTQADTVGAILLDEIDYTVAGVNKHGMPGDKLAQGTYTAAELTALNGLIGKPRTDVIAKVVHKDSIQFMAALDVATAWYNPQTLRTNHYLTFGYSKPQYLKNYPFLTIKAI